MKLSRSVALGVFTALVVPAVAAAHPGVYTTQQRTFPQGGACRLPDTSCLNPIRTQYAVGNDGWALSFTEGNNAPANRGLVNYKFLPGTWRGTDKAAWLNHGDAQTNLQAHATCMGATWDTVANRLAYQDDPFFNYIPWQKTSAGIGDEPSEWIPLVKQLTDVDLSTLSTVEQFTAACTTAGGTYYPADVSASITSALEAAVKTPLQSQITTLQTSLTTLQGQKAAVDAQLAAALTPKPRALALTLSAKRFDQGVAMVTGNPGTTVTVRARLSAANANKLKIARTISSKKATINADGAALVNLGLSTKAAKAVDKHRPSLKVTIDAVGGGVTKTATGTLTR